MPVYHLDRTRFEATNPVPEDVEYKAVVLENPYLRLTFLPELGGRLYSAVVKITGQEIFYHNPVVKPSRYGLLQPPEANWWLAMGGMEWAYPTQEHGYRWGIPWAYEVHSTPDQVSIILKDEAPNRVGVRVEVVLPADHGSFTVSPQLTNVGSSPVPIQFWTNATLSLAAGSMSPHTQFIIPSDTVMVHSRGADGWAVPDEKTLMPWPIVDEKQLNQYAEWANYLGIFVPEMAAPFMGAYNPIDDLGVARLIQPGTVPGNKLFAFSLTFPYRDYTDDASQYFELWGGLNHGFWPEDDLIIQPNQTVGWEEQWWPLAGVGGLSWANDQAAIHISERGEQTVIAILTPQAMQGRLHISHNKVNLTDVPFMAKPDVPFIHSQTISQDVYPITIELFDESGEVILSFQQK